MPAALSPVPHQLGASAPCVYPWNPDAGNGTYRNPIICADYSDPDVIRVGDDFYLVTSSFNCTPGLPILHSRDLIHWTIINHALKNLPHPRYSAVQHGCGVWAPSIRFHAGKFWIFFPTPDEGIYVVTASDPAGDWSAPYLLVAGKGLIDPCPLWDDDGQAYLVHAYAGSRAGIKHRLRVCPMAPDASRLLGEGQIVFHEPQRHPTLEGPKFLKRDGWYYIMAPAGGVPTGWQLGLRSRHIYGPYEAKVVLEQGSTPINGPHQGGLVDAPDGSWWFLHFQDAGVYGRIVHLQPVTWRDGWPLMGADHDGNGIGEPVSSHPKPVAGIGFPSATLQTSDEFDSTKLGRQWQWHANHQDTWYSLSPDHPGLRLFSQTVPAGNLGIAPNILSQKFPAHAFAVETSLHFAPRSAGEEAGLVIMGRTHAALAIRHTPNGHQLVYRHNGTDEVLQPSVGQTLKLRIEVQPGGQCRFFYADLAGWIPVSHPFQATAGHWIGAKTGVYALKREASQTTGHADFQYFRFSRS